ncbi:MAG: N-acetylglucosamine-6-phosphate deacetylase [Chitinophagaceae bacterium]
MNKVVFIPERIFDGDQFSSGRAVEVVDDKITGIISSNSIPAEVPAKSLPGLLLAPAFIELQIYGGDGQMFSLFPSVKSLTATYEYCVRGGATHFMATVATNSDEIMYKAIDAVNEYWRQGLPGLLGLHLEGPYLNPAKKGAHLTQFIRKPSLREVKSLVEAGKDAFRMMTLAPECCDHEIIRYLIDQHVLVSAGHSNATYEQAMNAFALGIPTATHLYNAMSPFQHRAPGLVGAIFDSNLYSSIVADGIHVDFAAVRVAKKIMGKRLFLITDAVTEARTDSYTYLFNKDRYITENGTLAGSCLTLGKAVKNLIEYVHIEAEEALRMASLYPAQVAGKANQLGKIAPGYQADMVMMDKDFNVKNTIISGKMK